MSNKIHVLAQKLMGKPDVEACNLEEIRDMVNQYPYFAPAQFLLLQKLKSMGHPDYAAQLQKSVLYYHNPVAFEYFINEERFYTSPDVLTPAVTAQEEFSSPEPLNEIHETSESIDPLVENEAMPAEEMLINSDPEMPLGENEALEAEEESEEQSGSEKEKEKEELKEKEIEATDGNSVLAFEPYHTVDYFASQGIKLSTQELGKDKFGKQLKSFTEWLKTMKKLPATVVQQDAGSEKQVVHLAEDSVHNPEVVTEAMAEVWLKQGNREKAIETYNKLSLQNPSKTAYFAALIENLKRS